MKTKGEVVERAKEQFRAKFHVDQFIIDLFRYCYKEGYEAGKVEIKYTEESIEEAYQRGFDTGKCAEQGEAYQRGLNDAWDAAKAVFAELEYPDLIDLFGEDSTWDNVKFFQENTPQETLAKLREYEQQKAEDETIHLGDEVEAWDSNEWVKFIACGDIGDGTIQGFDLDGGIYNYPEASCRKTGRRFVVTESEGEDD